MNRNHLFAPLLAVALISGCGPTAADRRAAEESIHRIYHPATQPYVTRSDASSRELASRIADLQLGEAADQVVQKVGEPNGFGIARRKDDLVGGASGSTWTYWFGRPLAITFDPDGRCVNLYFDAANRLRGIHAYHVSGVTSRGFGAVSVLFPAEPFAVGDRVIVEKRREWVDATVTALDGRRIRVHRDNARPGDDEWMLLGQVGIRQ